MSALGAPRQPAATGSRILGVGDYRPSRVLTNDELSTMVDTNDAWIRERTGIATRHIADADETVIDMAAQAGAKALAMAGLTAADIDLVVVATCTHDDRMAIAAPRVATKLGIESPGAYDVDAACAGFCYALSGVSNAILAGDSRHALVIGSEKLSAVVDWTDRSTCILFGDGAGAVVVGPSPTAAIGPVVWGSDGERFSLISQPYGELTKMDGPAVFRWATTSVAPVARQACERAGLTVADLGAIVLHQANNRIIDSVVRSLKVPATTVVAHDVVDSGNTSAASIPLALARLAESGRVARDTPTLLLGFGAGLSFAAQVVLSP